MLFPFSLKSKMKVLCWNVAGIRACLKRGSLDFLGEGEWDIVCFQETKAEESQVEIPEALANMYPYRYWRSSLGVRQRKGLSGTSIWTKKKAVREIAPPEFDVEGRTTTLEFRSWILVTVYTPNSQGPGTERHNHRVTEWDPVFREFVQGLNKRKPTIICGDFNVAHRNIDVEKPLEYKNVCAGFLDDERVNFNSLLEAGWVDSFREMHPDALEAYTFWDQKIPQKRKLNRGWRIDYFLVPPKLMKRVLSSVIIPFVMGSDHCPIGLEFVPTVKTPRLKIVNQDCM